MDTAQWPQEIMVKPMEEIVTNTCSSSAAKNITSKTTSNSIERKVRPLKDQALNCPRCNSTNTKFCYYNNYSLSQPRYFCKTCRRYWTEGGSLRNIPVGGGSRKNKRSFSSNSSASSLINPSKKLPDLIPPPSLVSCSDTQSLTQNPKIHHGQDLNLGYPTTHEFRSLSEFIQLPINMEGTPEGQIHASTVNGAASSHLSALELLNGITSSRGMMSSFIPMSVSDPVSGSGYSSGFQLPPDFKPVASLNFTLDGIGNGNGFGSLQLGGVGEVQDEANVNGRLLFPFEDLRQQVSSTSTSADHNNNNSNGAEQHREHGDSSGYWNGMLSGGGGGGGSW